MKRLECLVLAQGAVTQRADAYGKPELLFSRIAARWSLTLSDKLTQPITAREAVLLMLDMKQERAIAGKALDTAVDISGYGSLLYELDASEERGDAAKQEIAA